MSTTLLDKDCLVVTEFYNGRELCLQIDTPLAGCITLDTEDVSNLLPVLKEWLNGQHQDSARK